MPGHSLRLPVLALAIAFVAAPVAAQAWKQTLAGQIRKGLRSSVDTSSKGPSALLVGVDGLAIRNERFSPVITTTFVSRAVQQPSRLSPHRFHDETDRRLRVGDRIVLDDVKIEDDQVNLFVTGDSMYPVREEKTDRNGNAAGNETVSRRFRGAIAFSYSPAWLRTSTWDSVSAAILGVVAPAPPKNAVPRIVLGQTRAQVEEIPWEA